MTKTFALITERKNPPDRRVVFSPEKCRDVVSKYPNARIIVESSNIRVFTDEEYREAGFEVMDDVSEADVMLGVKEVPVESLIPNKKYFFFSHTIKKQPYNRKLLQSILENGIELYDHETIINTDKRRLIGFGYYAGLVGAYNGFRALGLRDEIFDLPKVEKLKDLDAVKAELDKITLPVIKIILSGTGKAAIGAKEILDHLNIPEVSETQYLTESFKQAVYCRIGVMDYNKRIDEKPNLKQDFYENPGEYKSDFMKYAKVSDMFITGHFFAEGSPYLFTQEDAQHPDFKINLIADVTCDVGGPIASTIRASSISHPFYGYDPKTGEEVDYTDAGVITVMAVDNLPCELPKDASDGFGDAFKEKVIPAFFNNDMDGILDRSKITNADGQLTELFEYLQSYVSQNKGLPV